MVAPALVFHTGFEHGVFPTWFEHTGTSTTLDGTVPGVYNTGIRAPFSGIYSAGGITAGGTKFWHVDGRDRWTRQYDDAIVLGAAIYVNDFTFWEKLVLAIQTVDPDTGDYFWVGLTIDETLTFALATEPDDLWNESGSGWGDGGGGSEQWAVEDGTVGAGVFIPGEWRYVEVRILPHPTNATAEAWIDGIKWFNVAGKTIGGPSVAPSTYGLTFLAIGSTSGEVVEVFIDDIYIGLNGDPLGNIVHEYLVPDASVESDGLGSDSDNVDNYLHVDDVPPDGLTYVDMGGLGRETYGMFNRQETGQVVAVTQWMGYENPDQLGSATFNGHIISGATEIDGPDIDLPVTIPGFEPVSAVFQLDPDTGVEWTEAAMDNLRIGYEVTEIV